MSRWGPSDSKDTATREIGPSLRGRTSATVARAPFEIGTRSKGNARSFRQATEFSTDRSNSKFENVVISLVVGGSEKIFERIIQRNKSFVFTVAVSRDPTSLYARVDGDLGFRKIHTLFLFFHATATHCYYVGARCVNRTCIDGLHLISPSFIRFVNQKTNSCVRHRYKDRI